MTKFELIEALESLASSRLHSKLPQGDPRLRTVFAAVQRLLVDFPRYEFAPAESALLQPLIELFGPPGSSPEQRIAAMFEAAVAEAVPDRKDYWTRLLTTNESFRSRLGTATASRNKRVETVYAFAGLMLRAAERVMGVAAILPVAVSGEAIGHPSRVSHQQARLASRPDQQPA